MAAYSLNAKEFALTPDEASKIANGLAEVSSLYNVEFDPRFVTWTYFVGAMVSVYAPKVVAYKLRVNIEKKAKQSELNGGFNSGSTIT
jgi:hypothetical protein